MVVSEKFSVAEMVQIGPGTAVTVAWFEIELAGPSGRFSDSDEFYIGRWGGIPELIALRVRAGESDLVPPWLLGKVIVIRNVRDDMAASPDLKIQPMVLEGDT